MRIVLFTSNSIRHKYFANTLAKEADDALVISECKPADEIDADATDPISTHFLNRIKTERDFFAGNENFEIPTLPVLYKEANLRFVFDRVKSFKPDAMFVFGSSILKEPLLSLLSPGRFINLHLGISPYYRGAGTNFWPFYHDELAYVGSTILHIDAGVDTGDIIGHVRPTFEAGDTIHSAGCKVIKDSVLGLHQLMGKIKKGEALNRVPQWKPEKERYFKKKDFTLEALQKAHENLKSGMVQRFLKNPPSDFKLIPL